jgi:hypothetical protein
MLCQRRKDVPWSNSYSVVLDTISSFANHNPAVLRGYSIRSTWIASTSVSVSLYILRWQRKPGLWFVIYLSSITLICQNFDHSSKVTKRDFPCNYLECTEKYIECVRWFEISEHQFDQHCQPDSFFLFLQLDQRNRLKMKRNLMTKLMYSHLFLFYLSSTNN